MNIAVDVNYSYYLKHFFVMVLPRDLKNVCNYKEKCAGITQLICISVQLCKVRKCLKCSEISDCSKDLQVLSLSF